MCILIQIKAAQRKTQQLIDKTTDNGFIHVSQSNSMTVAPTMELRGRNDRRYFIVGSTALDDNNIFQSHPLILNVPEAGRLEHAQTGKNNRKTKFLVCFFVSEKRHDVVVFLLELVWFECRIRDTGMSRCDYFGRKQTPCVSMFPHSDWEACFLPTLCSCQLNRNISVSSRDHNHRKQHST